MILWSRVGATLLSESRLRPGRLMQLPPISTVSAPPSPLLLSTPPPDHPLLLFLARTMSGWLSYLTGTGGKSRDSTREAIVNLREHLLMLDKKEEHLNKKIEDEQRKAKANATTNKRGELTLLWRAVVRRGVSLGGQGRVEGWNGGSGGEWEGRGGRREGEGRGRRVG